MDLQVQVELLLLLSRVSARLSRNRRSNKGLNFYPNELCDAISRLFKRSNDDDDRGKHSPSIEIRPDHRPVNAKRLFPVASIIRVASS